jgi:replicative DNA helicase
MEEIRTLALPATAGEPAARYRVQPHSIEIEQALLGSVLVNNEAFHRVADFLRAEHFYDPVHQRLFEAIAQRILKGQLADPNTLSHWCDVDPAFEELGGARYLRRLAAGAEPVANAADYGRVVHDLGLRRGLIRLGEDTVAKAFDPNADGSGREQIEVAEQGLFDLAQEGEVKGDFRSFPGVLADAVRQIESAYRKSGQVTGVPTALRGLDEKLGGLQRSDLLILAGRPSMGKTALAVTIAANAAAIPLPEEERSDAKHDRYVVGVFSLEMSAEQLASRLLSAQARIPSDDLRRGQIGEEDWPRVVRGTQELAERPLFIDDTPALSISALRTRARRLMRTHGLHFLVVDYLQLLRGTNASSQASRVQEIGEITQGLKAIAKELSIPVLALSQLSRAVENREDKRPMLSDLRESGTIEQDADVVMFVYREEYYLSRGVPSQRENESQDKFTERYQAWAQRCEAVHNKAEVIIAKQRHGPIGTIQLQFDASFGQFRNLETASFPDHYY